MKKFLFCLVAVAFAFLVAGCSPGQDLAVGELTKIDRTLYLVFSNDNLLDRDYSHDQTIPLLVDDLLTLQTQTTWKVPDGLVLTDQKITVLPLPVSWGDGTTTYTSRHGIWVKVSGDLTVKKNADKPLGVYIILPLENLKTRATVYQTLGTTTPLTPVFSDTFEVATVVTHQSADEAWWARMGKKILFILLVVALIVFCIAFAS